MYLRTIETYTKGYIEITFTLAELDGMPDISKLADELKDSSASVKCIVETSVQTKQNHDALAVVADSYNVDVESTNNHDITVKAIQEYEGVIRCPNQ